MDGSGKRLHVAGGQPFEATGPTDASGRPSSAVSAGTSSALGAEAIGSHYAPRRWALRSNLARPFIHLLCLNGGSATAVRDDSKVLAFAGPRLVWLPAGCAEHLEVAAGATGHLLHLRSDVWHRYLPSSAEAAYLDLASTSEILAFCVEPDLAVTVARSIAAIAGEIATPARNGAASIISSELTLCVLRFWRLFADDGNQEAAGSSTEILSRFRRLVEERHHHQLRVAEYADLLGVTPDRLHSLCRRALERSPSELIQQRIIQEAATRLETSNATVKQIAFALGFKDTAYFNRFFSKHAGEAPGAWRRRIAARGKTARSRPTLTFADWP
jgi:AraC family transcriptional regulator, transcriptional activator of pobA